MAKPARTDARPHVAKMWAARNITGSNALLSGERNRVKPGSSRQRAARPIPSGFLRLFDTLAHVPSVIGEKSARGNSREGGPSGAVTECFLH